MCYEDSDIHNKPGSIIPDTNQSTVVGVMAHMLILWLDKMLMGEYIQHDTCLLPISMGFSWDGMFTAYCLANKIKPLLKMATSFSGERVTSCEFWTVASNLWPWKQIEHEVSTKYVELMQFGGSKFSGNPIVWNSIRRVGGL